MNLWCPKCYTSYSGDTKHDNCPGCDWDYPILCQEKQPDKIWKIRHIPTSRFVGPRNSSALALSGQAFKSLTGALQAIKRRAMWKIYSLDQYEIVEYDIKEIHATRIDSSEKER